MAQKSNRSSSFISLAVALAILLLLAAVVSYLQSGSSDGVVGDEAEYAVLSQAIPLQAQAAVSGDGDAFASLQSGLQRLSRLTAAKSRHAEWQVLQDAGQAVLQQRQVLGDAAEATARISDTVSRISEAGNELFSVSGNSEVLFEFQHRLDRLSLRVRSLLGSSNPDELAAAIVDDFQYLQAVTAALAGEQSEVEIGALSETARDSILQPLIEALDEIDGPVYTIGDSAAVLAGARQSVGDLAQAAATSLRSGVAGSASGTPAFLKHPLLPLGILVAALLVLLSLVIVYNRVAVFKKTSEAQAQQNEKNQRAILRLLDELGSLADGDLTVEATVTEDITGAIADSINYAIEKLR
jgi:twitching motility protein PilJ